MILHLLYETNLTFNWLSNIVLLSQDLFCNFQLKALFFVQASSCFVQANNSIKSPHYVMENNDLKEKEALHRINAIWLIHHKS